MATLRRTRRPPGASPGDCGHGRGCDHGGRGVFTWFAVKTQLADENITVSDDAENFAGDPVDGLLTAYAEANVIEKHALEASGGLTYAELDRKPRPGKP